ncbi:peroxiredoxin family protein [Mongoliitalea daihaiensis]|uniref:peroxiredoxin family protein n=1 Tax=Mongoliitalea daihaiensis TaxID=2782006 RepID=UPI001F22DF1E|nr:TlpA disulfide reductase family protein [Mongoliitalea daihaiensis]
MFPNDFSNFLKNQRSSVKSIPAENDEDRDNIVTNLDSLRKMKRSCVRFVIGYDVNGSLLVRFDINQNDDFSDEKDYLFINSEGPEFLTEMIYLPLDDFGKEEGTLSNIPIVFKFNQELGLFYYSVPIYGEGSLFNHQFKANFGFTLDPENQLSEIIFTHDTSKVLQDELLKMDKRIFRNRGVDLQNQSLNLERVLVNFKIWSNHEDDYAPPFKGYEFTSGEEISSTLLQGKYVLMDFWGSWCGPCIAEIPNLKKAIAALREQNIIFLGIANDTKKALNRAIVQHEIEWPQILSDRSNLILEKFNISNYPTTLLIGPDGKIIAENIHGESLAKYIQEQIEIYNLVLNGK